MKGQGESVMRKRCQGQGGFSILSDDVYCLEF